jgi:hypothetical protein
MHLASLPYSSLIPRNLFILLALIGVLIAWRRNPFALAVATAAIGCLYLVAMPVAAGLLIGSAEAVAIAEPTLSSDTPPPLSSCCPPTRTGAASLGCPTRSGS